MYNLKIYQICHDLIAYFATVTSPKKSQLSLIFRTGGSLLLLLVTEFAFCLFINKKSCFLDVIWVTRDLVYITI